MCDYSLMAIPNRLAVSGEELVVHKFEEGSVGLASPCDLRKRQEYRKVQSHGFWARLKELFNRVLSAGLRKLRFVLLVDDESRCQS
jgi:hypothetical protein